MIWALHGNLGSPRDWDPLREDLPDLETVGLWESPPTEFGAWAYRLNDLVSATDPAPVVLGYSLGGRLAMHCATGLDSVWEAAIFVSSHPGLTRPSERADRLRQDQVWAEKLRTGGVETFLDSWNGQPVFAGNPVSPEQASILSQNREHIAQAFETWSLGRQADLRWPLTQSRIPQLWVVGEHDAKFRALAEEAVAQIPEASLQIIPGCGHRVLAQKPLELARAIGEFLGAMD